jgi:hypothetical protein
MFAMTKPTNRQTAPKNHQPSSMAHANSGTRAKQWMANIPASRQNTNRAGGRSLFDITGLIARPFRPNRRPLKSQHRRARICPTNEPSVRIEQGSYGRRDIFSRPPNVSDDKIGMRACYTLRTPANRWDHSSGLPHLAPTGPARHTRGMSDPAGWPIARITVLVAAVGGCAAGIIFGWLEGGPGPAIAHGSFGLAGALFGGVAILTIIAAARKWLADSAETEADYDDRSPPADG